MSRIGFLGAYSINNAGDVLVGYASQQAVRKLIPNLEHQVFAPNLPGEGWDHDFGSNRGIGSEITPINDFQSVEWARNLDAVIIGGGGIVGTSESFRPFCLSDPHKWDAQMPPAAWNGVCNQAMGWYRPGERENYDRIRECCERLSYVSVRNQSTERFLRKIGYDGPVHIIPDPAFLLSKQRSGKCGEILKASGVDTEKFLVGISLGSSVHKEMLKSFYSAFFSLIEKLLGNNRSKMEVVFFPFGYMYGDQDAQAKGQAAVADSRLIQTQMDPLDIWEMVGSMDFYIGTRFHSIIAAIAQHVPFVALDTYLTNDQLTGKTRELIVDHDLEMHYLNPYLYGEASLYKISQLLQRAQGQDQFFTDLVPLLRTRLEDHTERMVRALGLL